jgi:hypothetical protein
VIPEVVAPGDEGPDDEGVDRDAASGPDKTTRAGFRPSRRLVVAVLTAVVVLPLVVALAALRSPRWFPLLDLAMTELRVRDVGTSHTPLIGLVGRLSSNGNQGSHPGPISFWALAPTYRLLGGQAWALFVGVVVLNTTAIALTLWVAVRRGGVALALGVAAGLAVLVHLYGTQVLTEPWNPYMPVMWWPLTLLALWAVLCDDLPMLPVAVVAATFCMQTHISYLGLVGGFAAAAAVGLAVRARMLRGDRPALRRLLRWSAVAAGVGLVLWLPPIIDQITGDPGNASIVFDHFRHPDEDPIGLGRGAELLAVQLNPWRLLSGQVAISGAVLPGLVLVGLWLAAAVVARRLPSGDPQRRPLVRLHAVVALALVLGLVSASRILGYLWWYLSLWAWTITMLVVIAIGWTVVAAVAARRREPGPAATGPADTAPTAGPAETAGATGTSRLTRVGAGALVAVLLVWTGMFVADAKDAEPTDARVSAMLGELTDAVDDALDAGAVPGGGPDGSYLLTWTDGIHIGAPGFGMLAELERRGYDVGVLDSYSPGAVEHRVMPPEDATAEVHISLGPDIPVWDEVPGMERLALIDPRTDEEREAYERARTVAIDELRRAGHGDLVPIVDTGSFMLFFDDRVPEPAKDALATMNDIGQPAAVYVGPVTIIP